MTLRKCSIILGCAFARRIWPMEHVKQFRQGQQGKNVTRSPGVGRLFPSQPVQQVPSSALHFPRCKMKACMGLFLKPYLFFFYGHMKIKRNSPLPRPPHTPSIEHNFYSTPNPHRVFLLPRLRPATLGLEMLRAVPRAFRFMI